LNNFCGDGYLDLAVEECDDDNTADNDGCSSTCTLEPSGIWTNTNDVQIDSSSSGSSPGLFKIPRLPFDVNLVVLDSGLQAGSATFKVLEKDTGTDDLLIDSLSGTVDVDEKAVATWTITQTDIDNSISDDRADKDYEFYFELQGVTFTRVILYAEVDITTCLDISFCFDYTILGENSCDLDSCGVVVPELEAIGTDCGIDGSLCYCKWDDVLNACGSRFDPQFGFPCLPYPECWVDDDGVVLDDGDGLFTGGTCQIEEDFSGDPEGCADNNLLSYTWTGTWVWSEENTLTINPNDPDYVEDPQGMWHYDPENKAGQCTEGGFTSIDSAAQIQLPFFSNYGIFATALLIIFIYLFLNLKKNIKIKK